MANEMRNQLFELLTDCETEYAQYLSEECDKAIKGDVTKQLFKRLEFYADHLIENGVVVRERAKWIYATDCYLCSVCAGKRFNLLLGTDAEYCPYCGAKMVFDEQAEQKLKEMRGGNADTV